MGEDVSRYYTELVPHFYRYMVEFGEIKPRTAKDYMTRLKYLSAKYRLDVSLTKEKIEAILAQEDVARTMRLEYSYRQVIGDFSAGLNKFLSFVQNYEDVCRNKDVSEENSVKEAINLPKTTRDAIIQARVGQGYFRQSLLNFWGGCSISGCGMNEILIASHIKPWRVSDNDERLDQYNGLLLLPNYDKLFDFGYITIDLDGSLIVSRFLPEKDKPLLHLNRQYKICIVEKHKTYLAYHKQYCFME